MASKEQPVSLAQAVKQALQDLELLEDLVGQRGPTWLVQKVKRILRAGLSLNGKGDTRERGSASG